MREINKLIIHCADTFHDMDTNAATIDKWHKEQGFNSIGYHYVILRDGSVEKGRDESVVGAHTKGHNHDSIGVCLIGGKARNGHGEHSNPANFTHAQWETLRNLVKQLILEHPNAELFGHGDLNSDKTCPSFDVKAWAEGLV